MTIETELPAVKVKADVPERIWLYRPDRELSGDLCAPSDIWYGEEDLGDHDIQDGVKYEYVLATPAESSQHEQRLQAALAYWMPGVSEAIEIELNGKAGDDAYLLAGFQGDVPRPSWGDKAIERALAAEFRCEELVKALGFYADEKNWSDGGFSDEDGPNVLTLVMCSSDNDRGEIARSALASYRNATDDLKEAEGVVE